ncbi:hypothetical protein BpHYR1_039863 [Brachionus plicatilis]|uniref:Uncharacterized protein n=1 Tax=Brachionus plicatilis TaxID=10195 RepID=A0A3M7RJW4_BRAPC|nr:hypothetical protein BpHYR1_039863 [Brachionus plicatilis]
MTKNTSKLQKFSSNVLIVLYNFYTFHVLKAFRIQNKIPFLILKRDTKFPYSIGFRSGDLERDLIF